MNRVARLFIKVATLSILLLPMAASAVEPERLMTPVIAPPSGVYTGSVVVTLSVPIPNARIRYTLNGQEPNVTNSILYESPFAIKKSCTVKARAFKPGTPHSLVASAFFRILPQPPTATPVITPASGVYTGHVEVSLACATPDAAIRYTLNGSEPSATNGLVYTSPFTLRASTLVRARALKTGMPPSAIAYGEYRIAVPRVAKPTLAPPPGIFTGSVTVAISCETPGATILYARGPHTTSATNFVPYEGPITLTASAGLAAKAVKEGMLDSPLAGGAYTLVTPRAATPAIRPAGGLYTGSVEVALSCATEGAAIRYTLNGHEPTPTNSVLYEGPFVLRQSALLRARAFKDGLLPSALAGAEFKIIVPAVAKPVFTPPGGVYTGSVTVAISCATEGASILYATGNTSAGATNFVPYEGPLTLTKNTALIAKAVKEGFLASPLAGASFTIVIPRVATPVIRPAGGVYTGSVEVALSCHTEGAAIRYTLNGAEPGPTNSILYEGPFILRQSTLVRARAFKDGLLPSALAGAEFKVVVPAVAKPVFTPPGGTWTGSVTVAISCATEGASILYATGSSTAGATNFLPYETPLTFTASTVLVAKAVKPGLPPSPLSGAYYTLVIPRVATPVIRPAGGVYTGSVEVALSCHTEGAAIRYTLNGTEPNATNSLLYEGPFVLRQSALLRARAFKDGLLPSALAGGEFKVVVPTVAKPVFTPPGGVYTGSVTVAIGCETPGATILFAVSATTAGATNFTVYEGPGILERTAVIVAKAVKEGLLPSPVAGASFHVVPPRVATPAFLPDDGVFFEGMSVIIVCDTPGATLFYTVDGTEPTRYSHRYADPIILNAPAVIKARAVKEGMTDSLIGAKTYSE